MTLCECGCGGEIVIKKHHSWYGIPKFISGHHIHNKPEFDRTGKIPWNKGFKNCYSEEQRKIMSLSHRGKQTGENNSHWRGGKKLSNARQHNKRNRGLGFNPLNKPFDNSEGHHIDKNDIIYIPYDWHRMIVHDVWKGKNMEIVNSYAYFFLLMQNIDKIQNCYSFP